MAEPRSSGADDDAEVTTRQRCHHQQVGTDPGGVHSRRQPPDHDDGHDAAEHHCDQASSGGHRTLPPLKEAEHHERGPARQHDRDQLDCEHARHHAHHRQPHQAERRGPATNELRHEEQESSGEHGELVLTEVDGVLDGGGRSSPHACHDEGGPARPTE